ncbi:MAG: FG-GAP-like repeat-containing protein [Candidatus Kapabacteria bacterium]|jgi:Leucine-rich repeat (LRR) protein|nr:FG-GAP-like repeat-containing protein [Candidatus Kapabacteria bacterium]
MKTLFRYGVLVFAFFLAEVFVSHAQVPVWADPHVIGTAGFESADNVVDDGTNIYVIGRFQGTNVDFDPSVGVTTLTSAAAGTQQSVFIARYDKASGALVWVRGLIGNAPFPVATNRFSIALHPSGDIVIGGVFAVNTEFNPAGVSAISSIGVPRICYARYNPAGILQWVQALQSGFIGVNVNDIVASATSVYIVGTFGAGGPMDFDPSVATVPATSLGSTDGFVGRYDAATGNYQSHAVIASTDSDNINSVALDGIGNVWIGGFIAETGAPVNFNPNGVVYDLTPPPGFGTQAFIAKYDNALVLSGGNLAYIFGNANASDAVNVIATDAANNVYLGGQGGGASANFGWNSPPNMRNTGSFTVSYTSTGLLRWVNNLSPNAVHSALTVANNTVYIGGRVFSAGVLDFDGREDFTSAASGTANNVFFAWSDAATGALRRGKRIAGGGAADESVYGIAADAAGGFTIVGTFTTNNLDFDTRNANTQTFPNAGGQDGFIVRYTIGDPPETYTCAASTPWQTPTTWTPNRMNPCPDDVLIFPAGSFTVSAIPMQQVGRMTFNPTSNITLNMTTPGAFLLVQGDAAPLDVDIQAGAALNLGGGANQGAIRGTTGTVIQVNGTVNIAALPNNTLSYLGGWGALNVGSTGRISTQGPLGINGISQGSGAVQVDIANGGTIFYDPQASFAFLNGGYTGFLGVAGKPAITAARDIDIVLSGANSSLAIDNSVALSGRMDFGGTANAQVLVGTNGTVNLALNGAMASVLNAGTGTKRLDMINGQLSIANPGGLTFTGPAISTIRLRDNGTIATNPPSYGGTSTLEYLISANKTTTDIDIPPAFNGNQLTVSTTFPTFPNAPRLILNNAKTLNSTLFVTSGTLQLGGTTVVSNDLTMGRNTAPVASGRIDLSGQAFTANGNTTILQSSSFIGSATSSLTLGNGNDSVFPFPPAVGVLFDPGTRLLNNFTVNLTAGQAVALASDVSVGGTLTLSQGRITGTNLVNYLRVTNTAPGAVVRTNGWVDGPLERHLLPSVMADGTNYLFAIGNAGDYRPATLTNIRTVAGTPIVRMSYAAFGASTFNAPVTALVSAQNWRLEDVSAGFTNSAMALDHGAPPPANSRVLVAGAQVGTYSTIHGSAAGNVVTSAPLLALPNNFFTIGSAPLPQPYLAAPAPIPVTNSTITAPNIPTQITFNYSEAMNVPLPSNFFVHGNLRGLRNTATVSQPSATQLRVTSPATKTFAPGEIVMVTVTNATSAAFGTNPRPHVYSFHAGVNGGTGRFVDSRRYRNSGTAQGIALADFNLDGRIDMMQGSSAGLELRLQTGILATPFAEPATLLDGGDVRHLASADVDNDGNPDIVYIVGTDIIVRRNNPLGTFGTVLATITTGAAGLNRIALADFDGDGDIDIALGANDTRVFLNNGTGTAFPLVATMGFAAMGIAAADADRDGDMDLVVTDGANLNVYRGQGANTGVNTLFPLVPSTSIAVVNPEELAVGDFNGDTYPDVAVGTTGNNMLVFMNQATGAATFAAPITYNTGTPVTVPIVGLFDNDNFLDIVVLKPNTSDSKVFFYRGNGAGLFTLTSSSAFMEATNSVGLRVFPQAADMDGDGDMDIAVPLLANNRTAILFNHQPELQVTTTVPPPNAPSIAEPVVITTNYNQSITTGTFQFPNTSPPQGPLRVYGSMSAGRSTTSMLGTWTGGTNTAIYTPNTLPLIGRRFFPGEKVEFISSTSVRISAPAGVANTIPMTTGTVRHFRTRAGVAPATFFEVQRLTAGTQPRSVATADFNKDGYLDLCVANEGSNNLSLLLGAAGGVFGAPTTIMLPGFTSPSQIIAADFDNNGNIDIAVSCNPDVGVLMGNGLGGFSGLTAYSLSPIAPRYSLAASDMNGDGALDLIVTSVGAGGNVSVLPNLGNGTFAPQLSSPVVTNAFSVAVGDIDNDGDIDAVAAQSFATNSLTILKNGGNGILSIFGTQALANVYHVDLGDFNNDGLLDIAAAQNAPTNQVTIYLNMGGGVYAPSSNYAVGNGTASVIVGDFNGDAALDIITSNELSNTITFLRGNNTGTFAPISFETGVGPRSISAAGDFDNDGDLDFATANFGSGSVSILLNATQPRFVCTAGCGPVTYTPNIAPPRNIINAPNLTTLTWQFTEPMTTATASYPSTMPVPHGQNGAIRIFGNQRAGRTPLNAAGADWVFNAATTTASFVLPRRFAPGEEVFVSVSNATGVSRVRARPYVYGFTARAGAGPGAFYESRFSPHGAGMNPFDVALGDIDNDGDLDMAVANQAGNSVTIRLNDGRGDYPTEAAGSPLAGIGGVTAVKFADVNNDGLLDLIAVANTANQVFVRLNTGGGNFTMNAPGSPLTGLFNLPFNAALADFDADGDLDLAVSNDVGGNVIVRLNNGNGDFTTAAAGSPFAVAANTFGIAAGDVDNDGDIDIVAAGLAAGAFVLYNDGTGRFPTSSLAFAGGTQVRSVTLGRVNNDDFLDLVMANQGSNDVTVRINDGFGGFGTASSLVMGTAPRSAILADIDGDADLDLISANNDVQGVVIRRNDGTGNFAAFGLNSPINFGSTTRNVAAGDVDGDGDLDLVVPRTTTQQATVLFNKNPDVTSCFGNALQFNGVNSYARVAPATGVNVGAGSFTLEAMIRTPVAGGVFLSAGDNNVNGNGFTLQANGTMGRLEFRWSNQAAGMSVNAGVNVQDNQWRHIAVVYKALPADSLFIYVDGIWAASGVNPNPGINNIAAAALNFGSAFGGGVPGSFYAGALDEVRFWNTALTQQTINIHRGSQIEINHPNIANLQAYYRFNEGVGATVSDYKNSTLTGTFFSSVNAFPQWQLSNAQCGMIADMYAPSASQYRLPASTQRTGGTAALTYSLTAAPTLGGTALTTASTATYTAWANIPQNGTDNFGYSVTDGVSTSTGTVRVQFTPKLQGFTVFAQVGVGTALTGTHTIFGGVSPPIKYTWIGLSGASFNLANPAVPVITTNASVNLTLTIEDALGFTATTTVNVVAIGGDALAFSSTQLGFTNGFNGGNTTVVSRTPTPFTASVFRSTTLLQATTASVRWTISPTLGGTAQFQIQGSSQATFSNSPTFSTNATFIWRNAPPQGGSTQAIITLSTTNGLLIFATQITVTVIANSAQALALAVSPISSTGTQGVNFGAFNQGQLVVVNGRPFNVAFGAWNGWNELTPTQATVRASLTASAGETDGFIITNASVILNGASSGVFTNLAIDWQNPLQLSTTITLRIQTISGSFLQSTSVNLTLITTPLEPVITSFTPTTGATSSVVILQGLNLGNVTLVRVGGVPVQSFTINSPTQLAFVVSTGATGLISAANLAGTGFSQQPFTFVSPPSALTLSSTQAGVGQTVIVSGVNLANVQSVFVGGVPAMFSSTNGQVILTIPMNAQSGVITVQTSGGSAVSPPFTVLPSPVISGISPATLGTNGTVTITGANLTNVTSVTLSGVPVTSFMVISSTQIVAVISSNATSGFLTVQSPGGTAIAPNALTVNLPPTLTNIANTMPVAGMEVFIMGTNFTPGMMVTIGGVPVQVQVNSPMQAVLTMPQTPTNGTITITTPFGTVGSMTILTITPAPLLPANIDFTPDVGQDSTRVTITGQGFVNVREVRFGGVTVRSFTVENAGRIIAVISTGATGTVSVRTTTGTATSQRIFRYITPLQADSIALVAFFRVTDGTQWTTRNNWLSSLPVQFWSGVGVQNARVTALNLPSNALNGSLTAATAQLATLTGLQTLNLSGNQLPGELPATIGAMRSLRNLNLSGIGVTGALPRELALLDSLEVLRLDSNSISGSLEDALCVLGSVSSRENSRLRELRLNNNRLTGAIPPCIVEFRQLTHIHLQNNFFTGGIPERIVELTRLRELVLANNRLSGSLPRSFDRAVNQAFAGKAAVLTAYQTLERLDIAHNGFSGALSQGIGQFSALREFLVNDNRFTGALPQTLPSLRRLEIFDASRNTLTGELPENIGLMRQLRQFSVSRNALGGAIPASLADCELIQRLELDSNRLEGALPQGLSAWQNLRVVDVSANRLTSIPLLTASRQGLEALRIASNRLTFESIEGNIAVRELRYSPQDSVGTAQNLAFQPLRRIELTMTVGGTANRYQWFKNGVAVSAPSPSATFVASERAAASDAGQYECRITNTIARDLTLFSRPWVVRIDANAPAQMTANPVAQPFVVFPPNATRFAPFALNLRWTAAEGAVRYDVQVASTATFSEPLLSASVMTTTQSVSALRPSVRYFWRVRAVGADGAQSAWSQAFFTTSNSERPLQMTSIDFERVPLRETVIREALVTNFSSIPQILNDVGIVSDAPRDTNRVFRLLDDVAGIVIPAGETLTIRVSFTPRFLGSTSASTILSFQQRPQDGARRDSVRNILQGVGGALKLDDIDFDTVRTGGTTLRTADLVNLSNRPIRLKAPTIPQQTQNGVFTIEQYFGTGDILLNALDTVQVLVRCTVPEGGGGRQLAGLLVFGEGDSVQARVRAVARPLRLNDVVVNVGVKPVQDSLPPGSLVDLRLFLRSNDITPVTAGAVFRAVEPRFDAQFRMNGQVLVKDRSENFVMQQSAFGDNRIVIPPTRWNLERSEAETREATLALIKTRAVAGTSNTTQLSLETARFAKPLIRGSSDVFVEPFAKNFTFTARVSMAGGKRLIGTKTTGLRAVTLKGGIEISYTLTEATSVELALYDVLGKKIQTLTEAHHEVGEYSGVFSTDKLITGAYFLVLKTAHGVVQERVQVLR